MASEPIELPSLEQIHQMEAKRQRAIEALEISDHSVKCQRCNNAVPIVTPSRSRTNEKRIVTLQIRIKWLEEHYSPNMRDNKNDEINDLKQQLEHLQTDDTKVDKLKCLPLYSTKITGYKFVCSNCYDKIYSHRRR